MRLSKVTILWAVVLLCPVDSQDVSHGVQVLVDDEDLYGAHLQGLQGVLHAKAVLPRVLADLVEIPPCGTGETGVRG